MKIMRSKIQKKRVEYVKLNIGEGTEDNDLNHASKDKKPAKEYDSDDEVSSASGEESYDPIPVPAVKNEKKPAKTK